MKMEEVLETRTLGCFFFLFARPYYSSYTLFSVVSRLAAAPGLRCFLLSGWQPHRPYFLSGLPPSGMLPDWDAERPAGSLVPNPWTYWGIPPSRRLHVMNGAFGRYSVYLPDTGSP